MGSKIRLTIDESDKDTLDKIFEISDAGFPTVKVKNLVKDLKEQEEK